MKGFTLPLDSFNSGLNRGVSPRLIDDSSLSEVENFLPSPVGDIEKIKVWAKDMTALTDSGADDRLDIALTDDLASQWRRLPTFDPIERTLYLANNTYDTTFSGDAPYEIVTGSGEEEITNETHRFLPLRSSITTYIKVGVRLNEGVRVTPSTPIIFTLIARPSGTPVSDTLAATLFHVDGTPVSGFDVTNPENWDITGTERLHFPFTPAQELTLNAGEYYVYLTVASDADYYDIVARPLYRDANILGWAERAGVDTLTAIDAADVTIASVGTVRTVTVDDTPPANPNTESAYVGSYVTRALYTRYWSSISGNASGMANLALDYTARTSTLNFDEWTSVAHAKGAIVKRGATHYTARKTTSLAHGESLFASPTTTIIDPANSTLPKQWTSVSGSRTRDGKIVKMKYTLAGMSTASLDGVFVQINGIGATDDGITFSGSWNVKFQLSASGFAQLYFTNNTEATALWTNTLWFSKVTKSGSNLIVEVWSGPITTGSYWAIGPVPTTPKLLHWYTDSAPNEYWYATHPITYGTNWSVDDLGDGQTLLNQEVIATFASGTTFSSVSNVTNDISHQSDAYEVDDQLAEVMLYQRSASALRYATQMTEGYAYYHLQDSNGSEGIDPVNNYLIRYFSDGQSIYAITDRPPVTGDTTSRATARHINALNDSDLAIYNPKFIGQITAMVTYQNMLVVSGTGGIAVFKPDGLDASGRVKLSDVIIPNLEQRLESVSDHFGEGEEVLIDVFPPSITTLCVHGEGTSRRVFGAYQDRVFWHGGTEEDSLEDISKWNALATIPVSDGTDEVTALASFEGKLLVLTKRGNLHALLGNVPTDPFVSMGSLRLELIGRVGTVKHVAVSTVGACFYVTEDGALWALDASLTPKRFDSRLTPKTLPIDALHWDEQNQRLWVSVRPAQTAIQGDDGLAYSQDTPHSYVWESKSDSWWGVRNPLDSDANAFRQGAVTWKIGADITPAVLTEYDVPIYSDMLNPDRANMTYTPEVGPSWTVISGDPYVLDQKITSDEIAELEMDLDASNGFAVKGSIHNTANGWELTMESSDPTIGYKIIATHADSWLIYRLNSESLVANGGACTAGDSFIFKAIAGGNIEFWKNGVLILDFTNANTVTRELKKLKLYLYEESQIGVHADGALEVFIPEIPQVNEVINGFDVKSETAGPDTFIVNPIAENIYQPENSDVHALTSTAYLVTKEFDLGTPLEKVIREVRSLARLYDGSLCTVSVIGNTGTETEIGTFTGDTDFDERAVRMFRKAIGASKRMNTFKIKLSITSAWRESIQNMSITTGIIGNPRFPRSSE